MGTERTQTDNRVTEPGRIWAVVLAGSRGEDRLKLLILRWLGRHRPKEYCTFVGTRSMFQHTVDRVATLAPYDHMMTVLPCEHWWETQAQLEKRKGMTVVLQPETRGTTAGIFLSLTYIRARDPDATVLICPSDHFIYPAKCFIESLRSALRAVDLFPDRVMLLGVAPDRLDADYTWIQPGEALVNSDSFRVLAVQTFLEKPSIAQADQALTQGALWNSMVCAAKVKTLWQLAEEHFPNMIALFERFSGAIGTLRESAVLRAIYREMVPWSFFFGFLQRVPEKAAVLKANGVMWSDWSKPESIVETLRRIDRQPAFPVKYLQGPLSI